MAKAKKNAVSTNNTLVKQKPSEMCPPGYHVVQGHERDCKFGTVTWVDAHIRRNRGKIRPGLLKENIYFIFWNSKKKYSSLAEIKGYEGKGAEYDELIQFWLDYWKSQGIELPKDLDPLLIKAMIAVESTFNPNAIAKSKISSAAGLMQITDQSLRVMGGFPNKKKWIEMRNHLIHVEKTDKFDPVVSVAMGVRLLGLKWSQIKDPKKKNIRQLVRDYHSRDEEGDNYAEKVLSLYEKSRKKK
ncbi:MAG: transglycosylase SLT domain-containing protein [Bdellovibrionales bacterium]